MCCGQSVSANRQMQPTLDGAKYAVKDAKGVLKGEFATRVNAQIFAKKYPGSKIFVIKD